MRMIFLPLLGLMIMAFVTTEAISQMSTDSQGAVDTMGTDNATGTQHDSLNAMGTNTIERNERGLDQGSPQGLGKLG